MPSLARLLRLLLLGLRTLRLATNHPRMSHLPHQGRPLLGRHSRVAPLLLLLARLWGWWLELRASLLLKLYLARQLGLGSSLRHLLLDVGSSGSLRLGLRSHTRGPDHPSPRVTHTHLGLRLRWRVVRMLGHHACRLSLEDLDLGHFPLGFCHPLDLHGDLHRSWRRARRRLLLLLLGRLRHWGLDGGRLLLGRCGWAKPWLALGLGVRGGVTGCVGWKAVGVLELLGRRWLPLDLGHHGLLLLRRAHHPPSRHLLEMVVQVVLRDPALLHNLLLELRWLLLLWRRGYTHTTNPWLRHGGHVGLGWRLGCGGLGAARRGRAGGGGAIVARRRQPPASCSTPCRHCGPLHAGHAPAQHLSLLQPVL